MADWVSPNSSAAAVKLKWRAALSKALNQATGGNARAISINLTINDTNVYDLESIICQIQPRVGHSPITIKG